MRDVHGVFHALFLFMTPQEALENYEKYIQINGVDEKVINAMTLLSYDLLENKKDKEFGLICSNRTKEIIDQFAHEKTGANIWALEKYAFEQDVAFEVVEDFWKVLLSEARSMILDSYYLYLERHRDPEDRFYLPRRKQLIKLGYVGALQDLIDDKIDILSISSPPGTGKTTIEEMTLSAFMGWFPDLCNLFSSHSGHVTRMVYEVICNIIGVSLKQGQVAEYAWQEIFPDVAVQSVNAKEEEINLGKFKPFKTLTCRALGASQTGVTRCEGILCCDDLCSGIEMALSKIRLDKLWTMYSTDLKTRKKKGKKGRTCKELHIATRWSVWDVIGRLKNIYNHNDRCRFLSIPDIDPDTGESNFDYEYGVGFDVPYFEDIEKSLDPITYKCLYKNEPVEREGLLFPPDILRRYETLPLDKDGEIKIPDGIWAYCDTKDKGTDYNALGVFLQYGDDYYFYDTVFRSIDPLLLDDLNAQCLVKNNVQIAVFESNKEGSRTADKVQEKVTEMGGFTHIDKKYSTENKETRIIVNSPWIVAHVLFPYAESPDYPNGYRANSEMGQFMSQLCSYSQLSKNPHDDAPDMVTMLAIDKNPLVQKNTVEAVENPFRKRR